MLDIHTHILPGMDDGSRNFNQSVEMLRMEATQGVDRVVLTPHFYAEEESPEHFLKRRMDALRRLEPAKLNLIEWPKLIPGAEVAYFAGMSRVDEIDQLCIGETQSMLIEMPFCRWNRKLVDEITYLAKSRGIRPVLAHVERYMKYQSRGTIAQICERGIWIQANASFFLKWQSSLKAFHMLKNCEIHFIGSDCHNVDSRPPCMGEAFSRIGGKLGAKAIGYLERMEALLLEGE